MKQNYAIAFVLVASIACLPGYAQAADKGSNAKKDDQPYQSVSQSPRLLDHHALETFRGKVTTLETITMDDKIQFVRAQVQTEAEKLTVHLAPQSYLTEHIEHFELKSGQPIEIRGSRETVKGDSVVVASEIRSDDGKRHLRLRHQDGTPVWSGGEHAQK